MSDTFETWKNQLKDEHPSQQIQFVPLALLSYPPIPVYRAYINGVMISEWVGEARSLD